MKYSNSQLLKIVVCVLVVAVIIAIPDLVHAQLSPIRSLFGNGSTPPSFTPDVTDVNAPVDGGLSLLVAAGVGYGAKKMRNKKNKTQEK